jgi:hypothetical protein
VAGGQYAAFADRAEPGAKVKSLDHLFDRWSHSMFRNRLMAVGLTFCTLAVVLAPSQAQAQTKPFKLTGGGTAPDGIPTFTGGPPAPHNATGNATQLGKYTGDEGMFTLLSFDPSTLTGTFEGSFVFVAANGDRLKCNYRGNPNIPGTGTFSGSLTPDGLVVVTFIQEFVPVPEESTGKFATITGGSFIMIATSEPLPPVIGPDGYTPPFAYTWVGDGTLTYGHGH